MIQIDINTANESNLPIHHRKYVNVAWLKFLSLPLRRILNEYYDYRKTNELLIHMNGQVIYLEHILNHYFDAQNKSIYIEDATDVEEPVVFYNKQEGNEKTYLYNDLESAADTYFFNVQELELWPDFIIYIPSAVVFDQQMLKSIVNRFKLASKNYIINII